MAAIDETLRARVLDWMEQAPDSESRAEARELLERGDGELLEDRFDGSLKFGTAGLRGLLGAGTNRMNRSTVIRATSGLIAYALAEIPGAKERGICVGYDGRTLSKEFAADVAAIAAGQGVKVYAFDRVTPTPILAYACLTKNAACGVMVTASHNPPDYNGYKVYWENGAQIIPPIDAGIAAAIDAVPSIPSLARVERGQAVEQGLFEILGTDIDEAYFKKLERLLVHPEVHRDLRIAYTALHGVGDKFTREALRRAGFGDVHSVAAQAEPDGAFPTVRFPNPEESGAMDLVLELADEIEADLVLANDPDADRLAVSVREPGGKYTSLSGNEVGCLLGHYLLSETSHDDKRTVVSTIVSSPMLGAIAEAHGAQFAQTLTGFKWIANRGIDLERDEGARFVMGYEEALGYTVGTLVRDKDGVSAAAVMADMAAWCKAQGKTLVDELESAWRRYGMYLSKLIAVVHPGSEGRDRIDAIMKATREEEIDSIAGKHVVTRSDFLTNEKLLEDGSLDDLNAPAPSNVVMFELSGGHRVMARPSGTEPKIKFYFDARIDVGPGESVDAARRRGDELLDALSRDFLSRIGEEPPLASGLWPLDI